MNEFKNYTKWTLHHSWVILFSYLISIVVLIIIHGSFGFTMNDEGTYLSNALMHIGSGIVLALGTGILQRELLKKHFHVSFFWVLSLIIGFVIAELLAGIVTYCIFWFEFPLSVICVSTLSIDILPTPSANIGNLPNVFSGIYKLFDE